MSADAAGRRVHIDRLELDLRGIAPATAAAVASALGPALAAALEEQRGHVRDAERVDAGRLTTSQTVAPRELATQIAGRIAASARGEQP